MVAADPQRIGGKFVASYVKLVAKATNGKAELTGPALHLLQSDVGKLANKLVTSDRGLDKHAGEMLYDVQRDIRERLLGDATAHLRQSYKNWLVAERAGSYLGTEEHITPRQFEQAARAVAGPKKFAVGEAPMQDLIGAGAEILKGTNATTKEQVEASVAAVVAHLLGVPNIPYAAALAAAPAAGATRPVARFAFGDYGWQKAIAKAIEEKYPGIAAALGAAANNPR